MAIRVVVHGVAGRMGQEVLRAICLDGELEAVGGVDIRANADQLPLPQGAGTIPYSRDLGSLISRCQPQVVVDFSIAPAAMAAARLAARHRASFVTGTTGLSEADLAEMGRLAETNGVGIVVAANFALGAVLMIHLAKKAAEFFDTAEIVEMHHAGKVDAPSGTALTTARAMLQARGRPFISRVAERQTLPGTRGGELEGIAIHSLRLPGLMAHQEVVFGGPGQTLSIRHDAISRECYMPGVIMAIKEIVKRPEFIYGLEPLLRL